MYQLYLFDNLLDDEEVVLDSLEENVYMDTKICRICHIEKSTEDFYTDRGAVYSRCKQCCADYQQEMKTLKKDAPPKPSDGKCACCGKMVDRWYLDHSHDTKKFRGWTCFSCNAGIGFLGDNLTGVQKAIDYLTDTEN